MDVCHRQHPVFAIFFLLVQYSLSSKVIGNQTSCLCFLPDQLTTTFFLPTPSMDCRSQLAGVKLTDRARVLTQVASQFSSFNLSKPPHLLFYLFIVRVKLFDRAVFLVLTFVCLISHLSRLGIFQTFVLVDSLTRVKWSSTSKKSWQSRSSEGPKGAQECRSFSLSPQSGQYTTRKDNITENIGIGIGCILCYLLYTCMCLYQCWEGARLAINFGSWPSHPHTRVNIGLLSCYARMMMPLDVYCLLVHLGYLKTFQSPLNQFWAGATCLLYSLGSFILWILWSICLIPVGIVQCSQATLKKFLTWRMTSS